MIKLIIFIKYYFIKITELIFQRQVFDYKMDSEIKTEVSNKLINDFLSK